MTSYKRTFDNLSDYIMPGRILVLYGPRRVGKTFLLRRYLEKISDRVLYCTGEEQEIRDILQSESIARLKAAFSGYSWVVIDEAQKVNRIGQGLKLAIDHIPHVNFVATGSSSFELANQVGEPLTGRKVVHCLYPISTLELSSQFGPVDTLRSLEERLIFGSYPEILLQTEQHKKILLLEELRDSYLYKDILELQNIRNSKKIIDLLRLLALQVGKEVSLQELGTQLAMDKSTVGRYLDLLEKTFVVINLRGFSRNLRKEITKTSRYYFVDNGVMNAVLNNYNLPNMRNDSGALWENFLVMERLKYRSYSALPANSYFWRTYDQQEIDLVEEQNGELTGFEFKYSPKRKPRIPAAWKKAYPSAGFHVISQNNWLPFVTGEQ